VVVFAGLCITAWDSAALGPQVWKGSKGEMCFTRITFISLVVVVSGVLLFAIGTDSGRKRSMVANGEGGGDDGSIVVVGIERGILLLVVIQLLRNMVLVLLFSFGLWFFILRE